MGMAQGVSPAMQSGSNCGAHALPHGVGQGTRWCGQPAPGAMAHGEARPCNRLQLRGTCPASRRGAWRPMMRPARRRVPWPTA